MLELSAPRENLTETGFVRDYRDLDAFKKWVDDTLDHRHLNEAMGGGIPPSAENLALWIFDLWKERLPELTAVSISETPKTWATYRPSAP
jgi:6-pyruvoyltetrahydropterin/6-carboxytetrahydropterin synthase